jgi:hypothetical protein
VVVVVDIAIPFVGGFNVGTTNIASVVGVVNVGYTNGVPEYGMATKRVLSRFDADVKAFQHGGSGGGELDQIAAAVLFQQNGETNVGRANDHAVATLLARRSGLGCVAGATIVRAGCAMPFRLGPCPGLQR